MTVFDDASGDAPDLFHHDPGRDPGPIPDPFVGLYRRARRHLCHEILTHPSVDSVWTAALRLSGSPLGPIASEKRLGDLIGRAWSEARPTLQQAEVLIEADPTLLDVHSGLPHPLGPREEQMGPVDIATLNLRFWTRRSLRSFWQRRLDGELRALFCAKSSCAKSAEVKLKGLAPAPLLEACSGGSALPHAGSPTPPPDKY